MKNTFGTSIALTLFGESHGKAIGAVLDGMPAGIPVDPDFIAKQLDLRRPYGKISTGRVEADRFEIVSGVFEGRTTGTPLCILIPNEDTRSGDYTLLRSVARPGHADYTAFVKYHGYEDYRGGGHFSGRVTAALTAAGAIAIAALQSKGIRIGTHIARCAGICDRSFEELEKDLTQLNGKLFAVLDEKAETDMQEAIRKAAEEGDSVGGILETVVTGMPAGIGEPWFDTMEGCLAQGLFSIPGIKGVQFGAGFDGVDLCGSEFNDPFRMEGAKVRTESNNNGGINGGITNGMPLLFRCAVKPTPTVRKEQKTVDFRKGEDTTLSATGRHDPAIIHRARVVVDSMTAIVLCDLLTQRCGTDWLGERECSTD